MLKKIGRWLVAALLLLVCVVSRANIRPEYTLQHTYYAPMLAKGSHRSILAVAVCITGVGVRLHRMVQSRRKRLLLWFTVIVIFAVVHIGHRGGLIMPGLIGVIRKHFRIMVVAGTHLIGVYAIGSWVNGVGPRLVRSTITTVLTLAFGLVANLLFIYVLMLVGGLYAPVIRSLLIGGCVLARYRRDPIQKDYQYIAKAWGDYAARGSIIWWAQHILLGMAIIYLLYGLQLAFIPYSTAWDANHAYMFFPKIWADNGGLYWSDGPRTSPFLWYSYITQRFSSMGVLTPVTGIARDTMAIIMNFLMSAVGILTTGVVLFDRVAKWLSPTNSIAQKAYTLATSGLLLARLTSGMGAFLVFVDNKTDLGILLLVVVALLSGWVMIQHMHNKSNTGVAPQTYAIISAILFACAFLGKPTAFLDMIGFVTMVVSSQLGIFAVIAIICLVMGVLAVAQVRSAGTYLESSASVVAWGGLLMIPAIVMEHMNRSRKRLRLLIIWGLVMITTIVLLKLPYVASRVTDDRSPKDRAMQMLMGYDNRPIADTSTLVASTGDTAVRRVHIEQKLTPMTCSLDALGVTEEELADRQREVIGGGSSEDNGRYVGYGQRTITSKDGVRYSLLSGLFGSDNGCYTPNELAKKLCQQRDQITTGGLQAIFGSLGDYDEVATIRDNIAQKHIFPQDAIRQLNEYYQSRAITTTTDEVRIPYRRLVPANITFNRSLQNESSYYTDIGVVWLPALLIVLIGLIGSLFSGNRKVLALTGATVAVWMAWMLVADGIVWYGMGMIMWTIVAAVAVVVDWMYHGSYTKYQSRIVWVIVAPIAILVLTQRFLNMMRIGSQGAGGPFAQYKQGRGMAPSLRADEKGLSTKPTLQGIAQSDIFDLQFPHYNVIMDRLNQRGDGKGAFIAGTYLQYFITNQKNIDQDNLLGSLRKKMSDNDPCAAYLRLQQEKYDLLVIDPNIATVVLGEGNQSLKDRFIMKEDAQGNRIDDGVMSMITRLVMSGYLDLFSTNNLATHYAYTMTSEQAQVMMQKLGETDEISFRTRFAMIRFLPQGKIDRYFAQLSEVFFQRVGSYEGLVDMGVAFGVEVTRDDRSILHEMMQRRIDQAKRNDLPKAKRLLIFRYMQILQAAQNPQTQSQAQQQLNAIIKQSITSQSQIVAFDIK